MKHAKTALCALTLPALLAAGGCIDQANLDDVMACSYAVTSDPADFEYQMVLVDIEVSDFDQTDVSSPQHRIVYGDDDAIYDVRDRIRVRFEFPDAAGDTRRRALETHQLSPGDPNSYRTYARLNDFLDEGGNWGDDWTDLATLLDGVIEMSLTDRDGTVLHCQISLDGAEIVTSVNRRRELSITQIGGGSNSTLAPSAEQGNEAERAACSAVEEIRIAFEKRLKDTRAPQDIAITTGNTAGQVGGQVCELNSADAYDWNIIIPELNLSADYYYDLVGRDDVRPRASVEVTVGTLFDETRSVDDFWARFANDVLFDGGDFDGGLEFEDLIAHGVQLKVFDDETLLAQCRLTVDGEALEQLIIDSGNANRLEAYGEPAVSLLVTGQDANLHCGNGRDALLQDYTDHQMTIEFVPTPKQLRGVDLVYPGGAAAEDWQAGSDPAERQPPRSETELQAG